MLYNNNITVISSGVNDMRSLPILHGFIIVLNSNLSQTIIIDHDVADAFRFQMANILSRVLEKRKELTYYVR